MHSLVIKAYHFILGMDQSKIFPISICKNFQRLFCQDFDPISWCTFAFYIKNLIFLKPKMVALDPQDYIRYTNKVCHGNRLRQTLEEFKYHFIPKDVCWNMIPQTSI